MTNRDLEKKLRSAFEHAAPDRFDAVSCSAPLEKGNVKVMQPAKKNRYIARFAALAAALVLVAGVGLFARSNFRPEAPAYSADTDAPQLPAEPENVAPVAPSPDGAGQLESPATPAVPDAPGVPQAPSWPVTPDVPVVPMAPPVPVAPPDPRIEIALELAYADAGVEEAEVESFTVRDIDEQTGSVELEFYTSEVQYRYRVNVNAAVAAQLRQIISGSKALETALAHAGVDAMNTKVTQMLLDDLMEPVHYDYVFIYEGYEYVYEIDAATGGVLKAEKQEYTAPETPVLPTVPAKPVPTPGTTLLTTEVIEIACTHAGVPSDKIGPMELTMDDDEAVRHYDLKFQYEGAVYFYEIEASNGEILTWQKSAYGGTEFVTPPSVPYPPTPAVPVNPVVPVPTPAPVPIEPQPLTGVVPKDRAVQIAVEHAGFTVEAVRDLTAELDFSDNLGHYRIVFKAGAAEYLYKVHYGAGNIMEWTKADAG